MKKSQIMVGLPALIALLAHEGITHAQSVVAGPIMNPANGHRYYLFSPSTWEQAEAMAVWMGGHLAIIDNAAENEFLRSRMGLAHPRCFIGLHDAAGSGVFNWVNGASSGYINWAEGEPNNIGTEKVAEILYETGKWNNTLNQAGGRHSWVEISGPIRVPQETSSIQYAIDVAPDIGDGAVLIAPGTYTQCFSILDRRVKISGSGRPEETIIDGFYTCRQAYMSGPGVSGTVIEGLTFRYGAATNGGALLIQGPNVLISRCTFTQNHATTGGAVVTTSLGSVFIDCLFSENVAEGAGGAVANYSPDARFINCTFGANSAVMGDDLFAIAGPTVLQNSILWSSSPVFGSGITYSHCVMRSAESGPGYVNDPPLFGPGYQLSPASPCIDKGDDSLHVHGATGAVLDAKGRGRFVPHTANGNVIDIGAMEFQSSPPPLPGDLNSDGAVNALDIQPLVQLLLNH